MDLLLFFILLAVLGSCCTGGARHPDTEMLKQLAADQGLSLTDSLAQEKTRQADRRTFWLGLGLLILIGLFFLALQ